MAQIRSIRRSSGFRGNVGVLPFPRIAASQVATQPGFGLLLLAVAVVASTALLRVGFSNFQSTPVASTVPPGTVLSLEGQSNSGAEAAALQISQPSIQAERLQGSSADSYFQPTGGSDLQAGGTADSLQMSQSGYALQGSVGTSRQ